MKVRELAFRLTALTLDGMGDVDVFKSSDDEGNSFDVVSEVSLYTVEEMEREDMWIEEPRTADEDHVVLW